MQRYENPAFQAAAKGAIPARAARDGDPDERVMTEGVDFRYIAVTDDGQLMQKPLPAEGEPLPRRIVVDHTEAPGAAYMAVDTRTDVLLQVAGGHC